MLIRSGRMRTKGTFQQVTDAADAQGAISETWTTFQQAWVDIRPRRGEEHVTADQIQGRVTHDLVTRYFSGLTPKMRFVTNDNRTFRIDGVINRMERDQLMMVAAEEIL